jgi:uncharacterized protein
VKIAITGLSGLIGSRLKEKFDARGWQVIPVSRDILYSGGETLMDSLQGIDAVIHLSGAPILHRWSESYKKKMLDSRVITTSNLALAITKMANPPKIFISTSAVGIYSDNCKQTATDYKYSNDFLGNLCQQWEEAAKPAAAKSRLIIFRLGIVLDGSGGALKKMALPFRLGLGGPVAGGRQMVSWIHIDDLVSALVFALENQVSGTYNLCTPNPLTNKEFSKFIARALHRSSWLNIPAWVLKILYGQGASVLTSGQEVYPEGLLQSGFRFMFPEMEAALANLLKTS